MNEYDVALAKLECRSDDKASYYLVLDVKKYIYNSGLSMSSAAVNDLDVSQLQGSISLIIHSSPLPSHDVLPAMSVSIDTHAHIPYREKCMCIYRHTWMCRHTEVYSRC